MNNKDLKQFPTTPKFACIDTIGVPHPYMIGSRHVAYAADHHGGMLGKEAILAGEERGIRCCQRGCNLTYEQHEQAILVEVDDDRDLQDVEGLPEYLQSIKPLAEKLGAAGFAFIHKR